MAKTVTIYTAAPGAQYVGGSPSRLGHMWYGLNRAGSQPKSFGFGADPNGGPTGRLRLNDTNEYLEKDSRTIEISDEQYDAMKNFGGNPEAHGFDMRYDKLTNSCVDYTWKALEKAGLSAPLGPCLAMRQWP